MSKVSNKKTEVAIDSLSNALAYAVFSRSLCNEREVARYYVRWKKGLPAVGDEAKARKLVHKAIEKLICSIQRSFS